MNEPQNNNRIVLITGTSRGIGLATANTFLQKGYTVLGTSTSGRSPISHDHFKAYELDLSSQDSIDSLTKKLLDEGKQIDHLINNAAIMIDQQDGKIDMKRLQDTVEVNLYGTISLTEGSIPMLRTGGSIINISSELASLSQRMTNRAYSYRISKTALNMYTLTLSQRLEEKGIRVYSFAPGWVKTDMGGENALRDPEEPALEIFRLSTSEQRSGYFYEVDSVRDW